MEHSADCKKQLPDGTCCDTKPLSLPEIDMSLGMGAERFTRTYTMYEAAQIAAERNRDEKWSHRDAPALFSYSAGDLLRFCEQEDDSLRDDPDRPFCIISTGGAIGQVCYKNGSEKLEWIFCTPTDDTDILPDSLTKYYHYCFD